ncbi:spermidine/putrescine transport system ATP-binding protein [Roseovarius litoreus]|uniref:Spermidine/putrescine import ATP-binding protein PotA n=1 Tax=Roseovarius litoreus TaxID=1155722 RepID=A0A1M7LM83_9RHOB|nr:ABC transporter ATP-binding protein [Roseovarius litoreus]SHM79278.1 spermidine/putrescine transport system ATP-binding protein [Roseovarius litoreus]
MAQELIRLEGVSRKFGSVTALADVSLSVERGEFLALLGPSGCGKTTLLRMIAGFLDPSSGTLAIGGKQMNGVPADHRPVNTVFQNYALFPHMHVAENIAFGLKRKRLDRAEIASRVSEALAMVGMEEFAARLPGELSGGQQQRVALARAIVNRPDVLLLDEPLAALDLKLRKRMQIELKRLHEKLGMTFILVTHDQEEALTIAERIVVMDHGRIAQVGSGQEIYDRPATRFVADFIGEANLMPMGLEWSSDGSGAIDLPDGLRAQTVDGSTIMIRPESIELVDEKPEGWVIGQGRLRQTIFRGAGWRLYVDLPQGQEIAIDTKSSDQPMIAPGDPVQFGWPAERCRVLTQ